MNTANAAGSYAPKYVTVPFNKYTLMKLTANQASLCTCNHASMMHKIAATWYAEISSKLQGTEPGFMNDNASMKVRSHMH